MNFIDKIRYKIGSYIGFNPAETAKEASKEYSFEEFTDTYPRFSYYDLATVPVNIKTKVNDFNESVLYNVNKKYYIISGSNLVANVIYAAINCKSYPTLPRNINMIVGNVTAVYKKQFKKVQDDFYFKEFETVDEIEEWIKEYIMPIQEIRNLNLSQKEHDEGVKVDDEHRGSFSFISRYSPPSPEYDDFVDLDAFSRNLTHYLVRENIDIDYGSFYKKEEK